jgi:hypothetical protein
LIRCDKNRLFLKSIIPHYEKTSNSNTAASYWTNTPDTLKDIKNKEKSEKQLYSTRGASGNDD